MRRARRLITAGFSAALCDPDRLTALHVAAFAGHGELCGELLLASADLHVDARDWQVGEKPYRLPSVTVATGFGEHQIRG